MSARTDFIAWLREHRDSLLAGDNRAEALEMLGLGDAGLAAWESAEEVVTTLPHASPNVFFPRAGVAWYVRRLQHRSPALHHIRIILTHVNFSDLGWRPYAWWHLDADRQLHRTTLFTRNKKRKHVVVASQGPLSAVPESACDTDAAAARLALAGKDLSLSYLLVMASVERAAGLAIPSRTVYLPLSLVIRFAAVAGDIRSARDVLRWTGQLLETTVGRRIDADGELAPVTDSRQADVLDNPSNIALLAMLGEQGIVGGMKMKAYWPEVVTRCVEVAEASGVELPAPELVTAPAGIDYSAYVPPSAAVARALAAAGISYSQGMAVREHGSFAERIDPFGDATMCTSSGLASICSGPVPPVATSVVSQK